MASLYEQLMASKGAPKAAGASNSTQLRKAPMSLRSAMRKYAEGGDVNGQGFDDGRDMSRSVMQGAPMQGGNLGAGLAQAVQGIQGGRLQGNDFTQALMDIAKQAQTQNQQDIVEPRFPERVRPPERPEEPRYEEPRYEEPRRPEEPRPDPRSPEIYPQDYAGPRTTGSTQTQEIGPRTSYRINDDGSRTEIGYDGQPIANYTPEQLAMHYATMGIGQPEYRYVWNGQGYDKLPNGPQIGYDPGTTTAPYPEEPTTAPMPMFPDTAPYPDTAPMPMFPDTAPMPVDYYNPSPPMDFTQDPGFTPMPTPIGVAKSLERGGDIGKLLQDLTSRSGGQQSEGLAALIAKALAGGGGGGSLEEQRRLMSLLEMLKGR